MKNIQVSKETYERLKRMKQFTDGHDASGAWKYPRTWDNLMRWMLNKVEPR